MPPCCHRDSFPAFILFTCTIMRLFQCCQGHSRIFAICTHANCPGTLAFLCRFSEFRYFKRGRRPLKYRGKLLKSSATGKKYSPIWGAVVLCFRVSWSFSLCLLCVTVLSALLGLRSRVQRLCPSRDEPARDSLVILLYFCLHFMLQLSAFDFFFCTLHGPSMSSKR